MELCSEGHDEVCFDGMYCPACELIKEHNAKVEKLEEQIESLEEQV